MQKLSQSKNPYRSSWECSAIHITAMKERGELMATEYISRGAAICIADYAADEHPHCGELVLLTDIYNKGWNDACDYIRERLERVKVPDVAPVIHGRWKLAGDASRCSACERKSVIEYNYCPNCGAKMDGGAK